MKTYPIRIGIHETNSSSSHSFTLGPRGRLASKLIPDDDGVLRVSTDIWDELKTNDPLKKLSYLLCFAYTTFGDPFAETEKESEEALKVYEEVENFIVGVIKDFTGLKSVKVKQTYDQIDHQSTNIIDRRDFKDPEFIREFVFNPDTWLYPIWDSDDIDSIREKSPDDSVLYIMRFPLPGISPSPTLVVKYSNAYDIRWRVDCLLRNYIWTGIRFIKFDYKNNSKGRYNGDLSWGPNKEYIVEPEIIFPDDIA